MNAVYHAALEVCKRHADRLAWAMTRFVPDFHFPQAQYTIWMIRNWPF